jgi:hypothetical protein
MRAFDRGTFAADDQLLAVHPNDDGDQRFEGREILVVLTAKAERVGEAGEFERLLGRYACQRVTSRIRTSLRTPKRSPEF